MNAEYFKNSIRQIPDFPEKGIVFLDLTTAFKNPLCMKYISDALYEQYKDKGITKVIGIESRGFIAGGDLACRIGAGFVPVRKNGKLPGKTIRITYSKEYGEDSIEIHEDALTSEDVVLIHDDLLATGGTLKATYDLVKMLHVKKVYASFLIELDFLTGRKAIDNNLEIESLIHF